MQQLLARLRRLRLLYNQGKDKGKGRGRQAQHNQVLLLVWAETIAWGNKRLCTGSFTRRG